jgi:hypothetical protein
MNYGKRCFTLNIILYIHTLVGSLLSVSIPKADTYLFLFYVCFFVSKSLKKIMKAMFFASHKGKFTPEGKAVMLADGGPGVGTPHFNDSKNRGLLYYF